MKLIKLFGLIMMLVMGMGIFSSCSDDDDEPKDGANVSISTAIIGYWEHNSSDYEAWLEFEEDGSYSLEAYYYNESYSFYDRGEYSYANGKLEIISDVDTDYSDILSVSMPNNNTLIIENIKFIRVQD